MSHSAIGGRGKNRGRLRKTVVLTATERLTPGCWSPQTGAESLRQTSFAGVDELLLLRLEQGVDHTEHVRAGARGVEYLSGFEVEVHGLGLDLAVLLVQNLSKLGVTLLSYCIFLPPMISLFYFLCRKVLNFSLSLFRKEMMEESFILTWTR